MLQGRDPVWPVYVIDATAVETSEAWLRRQWEIPSTPSGKTRGV